MAKKNLLDNRVSQVKKRESLEQKQRGVMVMENYKLFDVPRT